MEPAGWEPTWRWTAFAGLGLGLTLVAWWTLPSLAATLVALAALVYAAGVMWQITLYPRVVLGWKTAAAIFVVLLFIFCDGVGRLGFRYVWRRNFGVSGEWFRYVDTRVGWSLFYPSRWAPHPFDTPNGNTVFFRPRRLTPTIEFSISQTAAPVSDDLRVVVEDYLRQLPRSPESTISPGTPVTYAPGLVGYRVVHETRDRIPFLRQENYFVMKNGRLFVISAAAVPRWFDEFSGDMRRFLRGLTFLD